MIWGAVSYYGTLSMVGIEGNMDSTYYCDVLEQALIPNAQMKLKYLVVYRHLCKATQAFIHSVIRNHGWKHMTSQYYIGLQNSLI